MMIYGSLRTRDTGKGFFPAAFSTALAFLDTHDPTSLPPGKHMIDGDFLFANVEDVVTEPLQKRRFELHRDYADIHLVLDGEERHLFASEPETASGLVEDALNTRDIAFYSHPVFYNSLILSPGAYIAYLPGMLHCPGCAVDKVRKIRKIVFKIHKNALKSA